jgi:YbaB/EbfC DNA-binding family protein
VTLYEYPGYQADKDLRTSVVARVERVSAMLSKLLDEIDGIDVEAVGGDGDVVLSVNYQGQLTSLSLAQGCTTRYTHLALAELINATIDEAVTAAASEAATLTGTEDEEALESAVEAFIDPDSKIWSA